MEQLYKKSRFNYITSNEKGELLIFNSLKGSNSFCKVTSEHKNQFLSILSKDVFSPELFNSYSLKLLTQKGIIVKSDIDETNLLHQKYFNRVSGLDSGNILKLIILTSGQCNFRCRYCYEDFSAPNMNDETIDNVYHFIRRKLKNYCGLSISWFGGEPLVGMDVIEKLSNRLLVLCSHMKKSYQASITSNGYLLSLKNFEKLLSLKVLTYSVTIDGLAETHDKNRILFNKEKTFDRIINNIKDIKENVKSNTFHFIIRTNFTQKSFLTAQEYVQSMKKILGDDSRFSFLIKTVGDQGGNNGINEMSEELLKNNEDRLIFKMLDEKNISINLNPHIALMAQDSICYGGLSNHLVIDSMGIIRKCTHFLNDTEKQKNYIGRIFSKGESNIDENKIAQWVAPFKLSGKCNSCFYAGACFNRNCAAAKIDHPEANACPSEKGNMHELLILLNKKLAFDTIY